MNDKEGLIPFLNPQNQLIGYGFWFWENKRFLIRTEVFTPGVYHHVFRTEAIHFTNRNGLNFMESLLEFEGRFFRMEHGLAIFEIFDPHAQETLKSHYREWKP